MACVGARSGYRHIVSRQSQSRAITNVARHTMGDAPMRKQVVKRGQQRNTGKTRRSRRAKRRADKKERFRRYNNPSQDRRDRDSAAKAPPPVAALSFSYPQHRCIEFRVRFGPRKSPFDEFQENPSALALPQGYVSYAKGCDVILDHKNGVLIREVPAPNNSKFDDYPSSGLNKHRSPAERRVRFDPLMSPLEAKQNRKGRASIQIVTLRPVARKSRSAVDHKRASYQDLGCA
eukprot:1387272-Amorphochlora_amoeboformis.AAC.1